MKLKTEQLTTKKFLIHLFTIVGMRGIKIFKASGEAGDSMLVRRALLIDEDGHRSGRKPLLFALECCLWIDFSWSQRGKEALLVYLFLVSPRQSGIVWGYEIVNLVVMISEQQSVRKHPCLDNSNRWSIDIQLLTHWELQTRSTRHRRCLFDKRLSTVWSDAKPCPESSTLTQKETSIRRLFQLFLPLLPSKLAKLADQTVNEETGSVPSRSEKKGRGNIFWRAGRDSVVSLVQLSNQRGVHLTKLILCSAICCLNNILSTFFAALFFSSSQLVSLYFAVS
ncbi:hypothetical protein T01_6076 [Trichinella spiralis]|uniref:Uncharacterized protein n=1 Tax=Trichinella spiralis TaxID=6334 RepID=A0A0V1BB04_TRISP|nr:hypothetical protein T01_6076 [Trichinella spiralis]